MILFMILESQSARFASAALRCALVVIARKTILAHLPRSSTGWVLTERPTPNRSDSSRVHTCSDYGEKAIVAIFEEWRLCRP